MNIHQLWIAPRFVSVTISTVMRVNYYRTRQEKQNKKRTFDHKIPFERTQSWSNKLMNLNESLIIVAIKLTFNCMIGKVENILKGNLDSIPSPSLSKHCGALTTNFWKQKVCWHHPAMFCLITWSKLFRQKFEFSLKVIVSNPGYLLKSLLLYLMTAYLEKNKNVLL